MDVDPGLIQFCNTDRQRAYIEAVIKQGSIRKAATALKMGESSVRDSINLVKRRAQARGYSPEHDLVHPSAPAFVVKVASTLYDESGNVSQQWVKTSLNDDARYEAALEAVRALNDDIRPATPVKAPKATQSELLNLYVITDYHLGMRAWPEETRGDPWDMERRACEEYGCSTWIWRTAMDDVRKHHLVCAGCDIGPIALSGLAECDVEETADT